ncbi:MAG: leucine-rich repeat domain-containing protein [Paludibacteraceae bacterium]
MKKLSLLFALCSISIMGLFAQKTANYDFTYDGLYYKIDSIQVADKDNPFSYTYEKYAALVPKLQNRNQHGYASSSDYEFDYYDYSSERPKGVVNIPDSVGGSDGYYEWVDDPKNGWIEVWVPGSEPYPVKVIKTGTFYNCYGVTIVVIPRTVTTIEDEAFYFTTISSSHKPSLVSLTIPENVEKIGKLNGPKSLTWLAKNCKRIASPLTGVESITFGTMVETIPTKLCTGNTELSQIILPHSVNTIGEQAFTRCTNLSSVVIGAGSATTIGEQAFIGCTKLSSLLLGAGCTTIGSLAFAGCTDLSRIVCYADIPPTVAPYAFIDVPIDADIEVPCGQVSLYSSAPEWKYFWAFDEIIPFKAKAQSANEEWGTACVDFNCAEATFTAEANAGFRFKQWSNGRRENPLVMPLDSDLDLVAEFEDMMTAIEEVTESGAPFVVEYRSIVLPNAQPLTIYDVAGRMVYTGNRQHIELPSAGLYLVQAGENKYKINIQ